VRSQPEQDSSSGADGPRRDSAAEAGWPGVPDLPRHFLSRPRLLDLLDGDGRHPLVLVSAPAGTGKTALVADWVTNRAPPRAEWVTFDRHDAFWPGLTGCLARLGVEVPTTTFPAGNAALDPGARRALALAVASSPQPLTVVVDGDSLDLAAVAADVDFLLRHAGHRLRLVLLTRADPVLPLYLYRLEETMTEVRMADLAFDDDEAAVMLAALGTRLTPGAVHALNVRTRGWVTGLRLAGMALASHPEPDGDVDRAVQDSGSIAEYLTGEVLQTLAPEIRDLLMALSVPDVIEPGLAEELGGRAAARTLTVLARENVFIEKVPGQAGHYRFPPFFRDMLRAELAYQAPPAMDRLQRRAATWFAGRGRLTLAVHHFAAVDAWDEAAATVVADAALGRLILDDGCGPLAVALRAVPRGPTHPVVAVVRATLALVDRDTDQVDALLDELGRDDGATPHDEAVDLAVAVLSAIRARSADDPEVAQSRADAAWRALTQEPARSGIGSRPELAAIVLASQGLAAVRRGHVVEAAELFRAGARAAEDGHAPLLVLECLGLLAVLACCEGDVVRGEVLATRAVHAAAEAGIPAGDRSAAPEVALAWVAVERFELRAAAEHVRAAERSRSVLGEPVSGAVLSLVRSRLQVAQGDRAGAFLRLSEAVGRLVDGERWLTGLMRVEIGQLRLARGEPELALAELEGMDDPARGPAAALVAGQARLELGDRAGAARALAPAFDHAAPVPVRVSAWLVECARLLREGAPGGAHRALDSALVVAREATLRRPFHEAAAPVRQLLVQDQHLAVTHAWIFERTGQVLTRTRRTSPSVPRQQAAPMERLTEKETEVLGHLAELLTTEEIAATMYISVNTVRTHVRNILRKLGVSRRNAAIRVARELELIRA
jgi:LuxR family transcriptional regulator, maltose regulon positive regulatory protein